MDVRVEHRTPTVAEYQKLRASTTWVALPDDMVSKGLEHTLFGICVYVKDTVVGIGRVIGDGALYFYVQDVMVLPEFQGCGIGLLLMKEIEKYLKVHAAKNAFTGLMAADGVMDFYRKFGYISRPDRAPGMYKMME
ncbi:MAG: GNAT family N-acetyltransferase [Bacteroidota bacterium]